LELLERQRLKAQELKKLLYFYPTEK